MRRPRAKKKIQEMEAFPAVGNQVQNKSETTSVTLSMRRSRAKKIVQKMQAPPATGKQVQNKLENSVIPRYLEQRRWKLLRLLGSKYRTTSGVRRPRAKKKCRRRKLLQLLRSKYRTSRDYSCSNFWCDETKKTTQEMAAPPATVKQIFDET